METKNKQRNYVIAIIVFGLIISYLLVVFKPEVERKAVEIKAPQVEFLVAQKRSHLIHVFSQGEITALKQINLSAEVSGKIKHVSDYFKNGAFFNKNDILLSIDDRDYKLAVVRAKAQVAAAEQQLNRAEAEADQAKKDLGRLSAAAVNDASPYALRQPQLKEAQAKLKAAGADLSLALLQLSKTKITAPFDGRIKLKNSDVGQYVTTGFNLAEIYQYETMLVSLPVSLKQLNLLSLSTEKNEKIYSKNSLVEIAASIANKKWTWRGEVKRLDSQVDGHTQLINLLVEIKQDQAAVQPLLLPGLFVQAKITAPTMRQFFKFPRSVLHYNNELWLLSNESKLKKIKVNVVYKNINNIFIDKGIVEGQKIISSAVDAPISGMLLRAAKKENSQ